MAIPGLGTGSADADTNRIVQRIASTPHSPRDNLWCPLPAGPVPYQHRGGPRGPRHRPCADERAARSTQRPRPRALALASDESAVWDLGHIAAYGDLWISHRSGGRRLLRREECEEYVRAVRGRTVDVTEHCGAGDGQLVEMVIQHECQHAETMLQPNQLARLSDLVWAGPNEPPPVAGVHTGPELADVRCCSGAASLDPVAPSRSEGELTAFRATGVGAGCCCSHDRYRGPISDGDSTLCDLRTFPTTVATARTIRSVCPTAI